MQIAYRATKVIQSYKPAPDVITEVILVIPRNINDRTGCPTSTDSDESIRSSLDRICDIPRYNQDVGVYRETVDILNPSVFIMVEM
jgi:hypothetical protein